MRTQIISLVIGLVAAQGANAQDLPSLFKFTVEKVNGKP